MARKRGEATKLAYVRRYGSAFRGWYVENGKRRSGPFMPTEEEAHHWAMRKREQVQRRAQEGLADVLREVEPGQRTNEGRRRFFDPARSRNRTARPMRSIPLGELGSDEQRRTRWVLQRRPGPPGSTPAAATAEGVESARDPLLSPSEAPAPETVDDDGPLGPITFAMPPSRRPPAPTDEEPESEFVQHLRTLDGVIHDFVGTLGEVALLSDPEGSEPMSTTRFARLLHASPSQSQVFGPAVLFGASPAIGLESLLGFLGSLHKTGVLRVQADDELFMVSIVRGDIVHGVSSPRPQSELLGNILVTRGVVTRDELERFFADHGASPSRIGEALNQQALVSTDELRWALEHQLLQLFERLLATETSEWCFHEGEATLGYIDMRMNVIRVLLESARKHDERNDEDLPAKLEGSSDRRH